MEQENLIYETTLLTDNLIQNALIEERTDFFSFAKHMHETIELYQILDGFCNMQIGNQTITCKENEFILILPNLVHSFFLTSENACSFRHVHFSPEPLSHISLEKITGYSIDFLTALEVCCTHFLQIPADQVISGLFQKIITAFQKGTSFSYTYSNLCLTALLLHCIEISGKKLCYYSQSQHTGQNEYISFTIKYIQQNYTSKIQIKDISDKLGISSRYLSKIFLDHMGMTLLNYINTYRMNQAIRLIADTDMTMTEIADHIGMNDSQHFSKLFKNTIGSTPCEYRKFLKK